MRLRKRNGTWHARYWENGQRVERSTRKTDKEAARTVANEWERDAANPDHAAARRATLNDAFTLLIADREEKANARPPRASHATVGFYREKAGHWLRILGHEFKLAELSVAVVKRYVTQRRSEPACAAKAPKLPTRKDRNPKPPPTPARVSDHTISKELIALRAALKIAREAKLFVGDISGAVVPVAFGPAYKPRDRSLIESELQTLFSKLSPHEAGRVAFIVATGAEWGPTEIASETDVTPNRVHVRGTKRATRDRFVPLVAPWQTELVEYAVKHGGGKGGLLFAPWPSVQQSLRWACRRAGIEYCTPNDLRRTFAQWMRRDGMPIELLAPIMGHATTKMLELVYGRLNPDTLEARAREALCPTGAPPGREKSADMADIAETGKAIPPGNSSDETGGPCRDRTDDQRIKSPLVLWPLPGKKAVRRSAAKRLAPPVPHVKRSRGGR